MILRRKSKADDTCTSAGRVTAHLLLSFLTLSPTSVYANRDARSNEQAILPFEPEFFNPTPEPPVPAEHVFVSALLPVSLSNLSGIMLVIDS